jgi:hypothetical protein
MSASPRIALIPARRNEASAAAGPRLINRGSIALAPISLALDG